MADARITWKRANGGSDPVTKEDIPRIIRALTDLELISDRTMIAVDAGGSVIVGRMDR